MWLWTIPGMETCTKERTALHFCSSFPLWEWSFASQAILLRNKWLPSLSLRYFQHSATSIHDFDQKWGLHTTILWVLVAFWTKNFRGTWYFKLIWPHQSLNLRQFPHIPVAILAILTSIIKTSGLHFWWNTPLMKVSCMFRGEGLSMKLRRVIMLCAGWKYIMFPSWLQVSFKALDRNISL